MAKYSAWSSISSLPASIAAGEESPFVLGLFTVATSLLLALEDFRPFGGGEISRTSVVGLAISKKELWREAKFRKEGVLTLLTLATGSKNTYSSYKYAEI